MKTLKLTLLTLTVTAFFLSCFVLTSYSQDKQGNYVLTIEQRTTEDSYGKPTIFPISTTLTTIEKTIMTNLCRQKTTNRINAPRRINRIHQKE